MTVLLAVALILVGLLAIPLELNFRFATGTERRRDLQLVWAFGLARISLRKRRSARAQSAQKDAAGESAHNRRRSSRTARRVVRVFTDEVLRRRMLRYLRAIWRAIEKRELRLRARIGLGDPADTGQLWAVAGPVAAALSNIRDASVSIQPDFDDDILELDTSGRVAAMPLQLIGLTLLLLMSPTLLRHLLRR